MKLIITNFTYVDFNYIRIDIHCKPVPSMNLNPHLNYRASGHRLGQTTYFNCPPGFSLKGPANITCLPTGK